MPNSKTIDVSLVAKCRALRDRAYAPYSNYRVAAILETPSGTLFEGVNVENISYGATVCAERTAIGTMVTAGELRIVRAYIATKDGGTPCGICLQSLSEFTDDPKNLEIVLIPEAGDHTVTTLAELAPRLFRSPEVVAVPPIGSPRKTSER